MNDFAFGPFTYQQQHGAWSIHFNGQAIGETRRQVNSQSDVIEALADARNAFASALQDQHWPDKITLIDSETDKEIGHFFSHASCGMTPGLIDDRSRYWIRSADRLYSRPVTLSEFAAVAADHRAPANAWIAGALPEHVMTTDADEWQAPSSQEIRMIVGVGSFTGVSGEKAAALVGISPQNFRKYTALDGAKHRQKMSYAMWHLLLQRLGVQRA